MKIAIVLFNLGGPDNLSAVQPFLFNLFNDHSIIGVPNPFRWFLAKLLSYRRAPLAKDIYTLLGGSSPLLAQTKDQAQALEQQFKGNKKIKTFIAMRYWHPMSNETIELVKEFNPDKIILLPLYPQFSTTTTGSSLIEWQRTAKKADLNVPTFAICCYPQEPGFIESIVEATQVAVQNATYKGKPRILFSAHGLPQKIVDRGDPYPDHIAITAQEVVKKLKIPDLDWSICYQSRVGPLKWIGPSTDAEIIRAARDNVPVVVVPIAFVSEHSETLVELDIEYKELALSQGVPSYHRVDTVSVKPKFIKGLKRLVEKTLDQFDDVVVSKELQIFSGTGSRICPLSGYQCRNKERVN